MSAISGSTNFTFTVTGLNPGDVYGGSIEYTPDKPGKGRKTGLSDIAVGDDGNITFGGSLNVLIPAGSAGGNLKGWVRPPNTNLNAAPITIDSGPAEITVHVP